MNQGPILLIEDLEKASLIHTHEYMWTTLYEVDKCS